MSNRLGWPSLFQAGCAAQEIQDIRRIRESRRFRLNVNSEFLVPSAPNFSEVGPPDEPYVPSGNSLILVPGRRATAEGSRGFQATVGSHAKQSRRGATIESSPHHWPPFPHIQSSLRDEHFLRHPYPWVETHGYHQMSRRDGRHIDLEL